MSTTPTFCLGCTTPTSSFPYPFSFPFSLTPSMQQSEAPPASGIPYLGSRISLVSKTDVRYEGFLFNIDTRQSTVALQSVRSFGTEGRRPQEEHVPPSPHVLQYATFKASEIKDLHVCEAAPPAAPAPAPPLPPSPPVQPPLPSGPSPKAKPTLLTPGSVSSAQTQHVQAQQAQVQARQPQSQPRQAREQNQVQAQPRRQGNNGNARTIPGMGGHLLKRKERRAPAGAEAAGVGPDDAKSGEFNFADGLNDFDKQEEFTKMEESAGQEVKGSYQKSSFFDTISCDALDRLEGQRSRMSGADERKLNTETFGAVGLNNRRNFRGRGRGRRGGNRNWNGSSGNWDGTPAGSGRGRNNNSNNGFPRPQAAGP
jgi:protein LSM14